jgi:hypothetical protein
LSSQPTDPQKQQPHDRREHSPESGPYPSRGSCYGFEVHSPLDFSFLRAGGGTPLVVVEEPAPRADDVDPAPLQSWGHIPGKRLETHLFRTSNGFSINVGDDLVFRLESETRPGSAAPIQVILAPAPSADYRENVLWTTPAAVAIALHGDLALHAACVDLGGGAAILTGPSGAGKTTMSAALHRAGFRVLADDLMRCRSDQEAAVFPGPAVLRLRHDAAVHLLAGAPGMEKGPSKTRLTIPEAQRGDGAPVPLRGIVFLQRGTGSMTLRQVPPVEALHRLWPNIFYLPAEEERRRCFQSLAQLVGMVPVWELSRAMDWGAIPSVVDRLVDTVLG